MARNIELARLFYTLEANTKGLSRDLSGAEKALGRTAAFVTANPIVAFGALGTAALAAAAKATQMAAQFETGISRVSTLVDTTRVDMKGLSDGVLELFRSLPIKSIDDLNNGLFDIISAGVPAEKALDVLRVSAEASVGGFTDVSTVVRGVTVALNVFGKDGIDAAKAADLFFTANKLGVTTIEELSSTIGNAAGIAGSLGVSLEDLLGTVTTLTTKGLDTSVAMNAVRQVLVNIAKPAEALRKEFPGLADEFDLAALKSKGLAGFLTDLAKELKGNDTAAVKMFGSVEALGAVMALTQDGGAKLNSVMAELNNSTGAAAEAFGKASNNTENLNQVLRNQLSAAMIELGNTLLPIVNSGLQGLVETLERINGIPLNIAQQRIRDTATQLDKLTGEAREQALRRLANALRSLVEVDPTGRLTAIGRSLLGGLDQDTLRSLITGFGSLREAARQAGKDVSGIDDTLRRLGTELKTRTPAAAKSAADSLGQVGKAAGDAGEGLGDLGKGVGSAVSGLGSVGSKSDQAAARLRALNDEIAVLTIQAERQITAARARELLQRERDLGTSTERQVSTIKDAYREIDRLNILLAVSFTRDLVPAVEQTETTIDKFSARALPDLKDGFDEIAEATGMSREEVIKHAEAGGRWIKVGKQWVATAGDAGETTKDLGKSLENSARSAIDAAGGLGLIDRAAQGTLNTLVNLGTSIGAVFSGAGTVEGVVGAVAAVGSLLKGIFGGKSVAQKEAESTLRKNTVVLEETNRRLGDVARLSTPGGEFADVQDVLGKFLGPLSSFADTVRVQPAGLENLPGLKPGGLVTLTELLKLLSAEGLGLTDLDRIAQDVGLTIRDKSGSLLLGALRQLLALLGDIEPTQFGSTFRGQREALSREASIFDLGAAEQAQRLAALAGGDLGSSVIGSRLGGLDFGTAAGRDAGLEAIRQLFRDLPTLSARDLGGLSGSEFLAVLDDLKAFLEQAAGDLGDLAKPGDVPLSTPDPIPVTFAGGQTTTPSVADALIPAAISQEALMADLLVVNQDQLGTLRLIEQHLREAFSPVAAPLFASLAAPQRASGTSGVSAFGGGPTISITIQNLSIDARIPGAGEISIDDIIAQLSAGLAREILQAEQASGVARARLN